MGIESDSGSAVRGPNGFDPARLVERDGVDDVFGNNELTVFCTVDVTFWVVDDVDDCGVDVVFGGVVVGVVVGAGAGAVVGVVVGAGAVVGVVVAVPDVVADEVAAPAGTKPATETAASINPDAATPAFANT